MARRWRNFTDLNDTELKRLYTQMLPPGLKAHDVEIKNHGAGGGRGTAYYAGSAYHTTARPFVVVSVPKTDKASRVRRKAHDGYLPVDTGSRMEVFVYILAHELRHLWQAKSKGRPRGMVYGAKGRFSERDACAYGMQMLRRYRRGSCEDENRRVVGIREWLNATATKRNARPRWLNESVRLRRMWRRCGRRPCVPVVALNPSTSIRRRTKRIRAAVSATWRTPGPWPRLLRRLPAARRCVASAT